MVYNANKLASLVKKKKQLQNWLDYYQLKFSRNSANRPLRKVIYVLKSMHRLFLASQGTSPYNFMIFITLFLTRAQCPQMGFLGLWGKKVDAIDHYTTEIEKVSKEVSLVYHFFYYFLNVKS